MRHRIAGHKDNERLGFLGDAVLELTVSEFLYESYPGRSEGELTKLRASIVCEPSLVTFAEDLDFGALCIAWQRGRVNRRAVTPSSACGCFRSPLSELYILDQGLDSVKGFLKTLRFR